LCYFVDDFVFVDLFMHYLSSFPSILLFFLLCPFTINYFASFLNKLFIQIW
jgi:hypothetical protein